MFTAALLTMTKIMKVVSVSADKRMDKEDMVHTHSEIMLLSHRKNEILPSAMT